MIREVAYSIQRALEAADFVMRAGQLAAALEVCGYPKPGNVHRLRDYSDTKFEHFIAGSIAMGPALREAALRGARVGMGELEASEVGVGELIRKTLGDVREWHRGGNTHLGIALLFIPLAAAAGASCAEGGLDLEGVRRAFGSIARSTTARDAAEFYRAISEVKPGGLGRVEGLPDVSAPESAREVESEGLTLYELMVASSAWDMVAAEFARELEKAALEGYPSILELLEETDDLNVAIVHTYLRLLSRHPDTFVARKYGLRFVEDAPKAVEVGMRAARRVSERARGVLELGGLLSEEGTEALREFDEELAEEGLNPGSTADIVATSLFLALLLGLRP